MELDSNDIVSLTNNETGQAYSLSNIATVEANKKLYSKRQVKNADKVEVLMAALAYPSRKDLIMMIRNRLIDNCPITVNDVKRYYEIYGNSEGAIKGKTKRKKPDQVTTERLVSIPAQVLVKHRIVSLCADLFFINGFPYLTTISKGIMFTTVEMMQNRKYDTILDGLLSVIAFYKVKGFNVKYVFSDNEFKSMKDAILEEGKADLNVAATKEHVPEVEVNIKVVKERVRSTIHGMPYKKLPRNFKRELVLCCVSMLNAIPRRAGISQTYSPRELVTGKSLNFAKHCKIAPGKYCLVHEDNLHTNTMEPRALRAVAIGGANNMQGSHRFLMLGTGSIVTRRSWTPMELTDDVIARVHELAGTEEDQHMEIDYRGTFYKTGDADEDLSDDEISIGEASEDASESSGSGFFVASSSTRTVSFLKYENDVIPTFQKVSNSFKMVLHLHYSSPRRPNVQPIIREPQCIPIDLQFDRLHVLSIFCKCDTSSFHCGDGE